MAPILAVHGGPPAVASPPPHFTWPPIDDGTVVAVLEQLGRSISIYDRSGIIAELEDALRAYFGVRHAVLTSSGTSALHSMYAALELGPGDEVIAPAYTFHATVTPLFHLGVRPILVDSDDSGNIDPAAVAGAITANTRAIVVTHLWGMPCDMTSLRAVAARHGLPLLEDASHAHGAAHKSTKVGTSDAAAFSLNGPKPLSAGEGGFVLTSHDETYYRLLLHGHYNKRCRREIPRAHALANYSTTGMGLKFRIHPLAAALARNQLSHLDAYLAGRRLLARRMINRLRDLPGIAVPKVPDDIKPSWYGLCLHYRPDELDGLPIGDFVAALEAEGCAELDQPGSTSPLNLHPLFNDPTRLFPHLPRDWPRYQPGDFPTAERVHAATLKLPVWHRDQDTYLVDAYMAAFHKVIDHHTQLLRRSHDR